MKRASLVLSILIGLALSTPVVAALETVRSYNARGIAMGNAILADDDPINGFLYNPALVAYAKELQWQGIFGLPFTALDAGQFMNFDSSLIIPFTHHFKYDKIFKNFVMGLSFTRFQVTSENAGYITGDELNYAEHLFAVTVAKKFENLFSYGTILSFGATANIFYQTLGGNLSTENNPYINTFGKVSFGLDVGATYFLNKNMIIAGAIENIVPPDTSFSAENKDYQPTTSKIGLSWKFPKLFFMKNATLAGAMWFRNWDSKEDSRTAPREYHLGYEFWEWEKLLGVRFGYQWSDYGKSQIKGMSVISAGLACAKAFSSHEIQVDYAFQMPLSFNADNAFVGTYGSHTFALTYRWAWPASSFEFDPQKRDELRQIEDLKKQYQQDQTTERQDTKAQDQAVAATGSVGTANLNDPDSITTKAMKDRNQALLELYNGYVKQRDDTQAEIKKTRDDNAKKLADLDKKIAAEQKKLDSAKPEDKPAIENEIKDLTAQKDTIVKETNTQVANLEKKLPALRKDTAAKLKTIDTAWQRVWRSNQKKVTENFKEEQPSFDYDGFQKELSQK